MDALPEDAAARREALAQWAEQQRPRSSPRARLAGWRARLVAQVVEPHRLRRALRFADSVVERFGDRLLGRGLDTSHSLSPDDGVLHLSSAWHVLPRALRSLGISDSDTFVDFGCGKGRVVHQAARWPFRRVIGVEISPDLAEIARTGLAAQSHQHRCQNVEIVVSDVTQFRVPDDLTIAYFFRPFGDETLDAVLRGIIESIDRHPRRVGLIYVWPTDSVRSMIVGTERFRLLKEQSASLFNRGIRQVAIFESS